LALADAHTLTYNKKIRPVNSTVKFGGKEHTMVRLPVTDLVSGDMFTVTFPAPTDLGLFTTGLVTTSHNADAFVSNMTIDSYPAQVQVTDGLNYLIQSDGLGGYIFTVTGTVGVSVSIDLGSTIMTIYHSLDATNKNTGLPYLTNVNTGPSANAVPYAKWAKYTDQLDLVDALNKWLNSIVIKMK
jgi:hypothetical protein